MVDLAIDLCLSRPEDCASGHSSPGPAQPTHSGNCSTDDNDFVPDNTAAMTPSLLHKAATVPRVVLLADAPASDNMGLHDDVHTRDAVLASMPVADFISTFKIEEPGAYGDPVATAPAADSVQQGSGTGAQR